MLGARVRRAAELLRLCRARIAGARFEVEQVVGELEAEADQAAAADDDRRRPTTTTSTTTSDDDVDELDDDIDGIDGIGDDATADEAERLSRPQSGRNVTALLEDGWTVVAVDGRGPPGGRGPATRG